MITVSVAAGVFFVGVGVGLMIASAILNFLDDED